MKSLCTSRAVEREKPLYRIHALQCLVQLQRDERLLVALHFRRAWLR